MSFSPQQYPLAVTGKPIDPAAGRQCGMNSPQVNFQEVENIKGGILGGNMCDNFKLHEVENKKCGTLGDNFGGKKCGNSKIHEVTNFEVDHAGDQKGGQNSSKKCGKSILREPRVLLGDTFGDNVCDNLCDQADEILLEPNDINCSPSNNLPRPPRPAIPSLEGIRQKIASQSTLPVGGRLKFFWPKWRELGAPKSIVRILKRGYALPFIRSKGALPQLDLKAVCPSALATSYSQGSELQLAMKAKIAELLQKKAISVVPAGTKAFFNRVFLVPKKTGGHRLILDVSPLNEYLQYKHFCMDTVAVIRESLQQGAWATSVDFSDAYHHIPIKQDHWRYLCFCVDGVYYWFVALPFGLSPAPRLFTDVLRPVKIWARKQSMLMFQYLDDWLNAADRAAVAAMQTLVFIDKCVDLGLMVNLAKSEIVPKQNIVFLGFEWDMVNACLRPTESAITATQSLISRVRRHQTPQAWLVEKLLGKLVSLEPAVPWGRINLRHFQRCVKLALRADSRWIPTQMTAQAWKNLDWWSNRGNTLQGKPFRQSLPVFNVQTDASTAGWGVIWDEKVTKGVWSLAESKLHINVLEMRAILIACQTYASQWANSCVHFRVDNTTAIAYVKHQGGTHSWPMMLETEKLFHLLQQFNIQVTVSHLAGLLNVMADLASRQGQIISTEWSLSDRCFRWIVKHSKWGPPKCDLFANALNHKLSCYVSACLDPKAVASDAMSCLWPELLLYAFPPPALLPGLVKRLRLIKGRQLLLIAPWSPSAAWFPTLQRLSSSRPVGLPVTSDMLRQPHWHCFHPQPQILALHLWHIVTGG